MVRLKVEKRFIKMEREKGKRDKRKERGRRMISFIDVPEKREYFESKYKFKISYNYNEVEYIFSGK